MFFCQTPSFKRFSNSVTHFIQNVLLSFLLTFMHTTGFYVIIYGRICMSLVCRCIYPEVSLARRKERQPSHFPIWRNIGKSDCSGSTRSSEVVYISNSTTFLHLFRPPSPAHQQFHLIRKKNSELGQGKRWSSSMAGAALLFSTKKCPCIQTPSPSCCGGCSCLL